ncbi:MAG TPA: DNA recombination protein RmuC [Ideonella sp.]|uniref:DNA recombination protein RmuC n=1 Tax=Ideonella sp. TaxID=1929293 RepID=UPI002C22434D|nr:DNA recombination protein RmuC [Ideonella sp.]HSI50894.1 DNA recombination protein RmuC [Ideonella sp.]
MTVLPAAASSVSVSSFSVNSVEAALLALLALNLIAVLALWLRRGDGSAAAVERLERELRGEVQGSARATRTELAQGLAHLQQGLLTQAGDAARTLAQAREAQELALRRLAEALTRQLQSLSEANERKQAELRVAVEQRLAQLQQGNEQKLEQMRATVDEKLHATLEQRLGESFRQVAERLEQVHKGLGEMQGLARDVGSLQRVLNNVKTRGVFGELQLAALLEQVLAPDQYAANVETVPGSGARVEFAIRLPGRRDDGQALWLPIDAKFPREDYERLLLAQEQADPVAAEAAARALEARLRQEARSIREKYVAAPHTTDFALLFLPTEGLYAEALRRPGLVEGLQRDHRITLVGPTTLLATLSSLQMGFRTLALEKRSAEVWEVLGAVKTEFGKFGEVLAKTKKKLEEASSSIDAAEVRTRVMARKLKGVEQMSEPQAAQLLGAAAAPLDELREIGE